MRDYNPHKKHGTRVTRLVCALLFLAFAFMWLYFFQADVIGVAQHILSGGQTHYDRLVGCIVVMAALMLLQLGVYAVTRLSRRTHALTYLPSMLLLAIISDVPSDILEGYSLGYWRWLVPVVLVMWGVAVWLSKKLLPFENDEKQLTGLFSRRMWINVAQMSVMMLAVACFSNTNAAFHFRCHAETALMQGRLDEALSVGRRSNETDASLTMLRIYTLARQGQLGERLFEYQLKGRSTDMLPLKGSRGELLMMPADSIWKSFGVRPLYPMSTGYFLREVLADSIQRPMAADYLLCGLLLDRKLQEFADMLPRFYPDSIPLPRYYQEALHIFRYGLSEESEREENPGSYSYYYRKSLR